jgi:hypothetical protein
VRNFRSQSRDLAIPRSAGAGSPRRPRRAGRKDLRELALRRLAAASADLSASRVSAWPKLEDRIIPVHGATGILPFLVLSVCSVVNRLFLFAAMSRRGQLQRPPAASTPRGGRGRGEGGFSLLPFFNSFNSSFRPVSVRLLSRFWKHRCPCRCRAQRYKWFNFI